jgi:hypothetical protein
MTLDTKINNATELAEISRKVATCQRALDQLADTCCIAQRSAHMATLTDEIQALDLTTGLQGQLTLDEGAADRAIAQVGLVGSALGRLYATCCTPTREKLYVLMFKALGDIHTECYKLKGVTH